MSAGGSKKGALRRLPPTQDEGSELDKLPRAIAIIALGAAPMLVLAGLARMHIVETVSVPKWLAAGMLVLASVAYFIAMAGATGQRVLAAVLAIGLPLVLYYFSSYGGPSAVIAPFALVTMWIVALVATISFATLGDSQ